MNKPNNSWTSTYNPTDYSCNPNSLSFFSLFPTSLWFSTTSPLRHLRDTNNFSRLIHSILCFLKASNATKVRASLPLSICSLDLINLLIPHESKESEACCWLITSGWPPLQSYTVESSYDGLNIRVLISILKCRNCFNSWREWWPLNDGFDSYLSPFLFLTNSF